MRKKIAAGNWKMNGRGASIAALENFAAGANAQSETIICLPFPYIPRAVESFANDIFKIGAQNCAAFDDGAYTGEVSADMLADIGASHVILGHSERRELFGESNETVCGKAERAVKAGLTVILCCGETKSERQAGKAFETIAAQLAASLPCDANAKDFVIAYEPIWAIGTGDTASLDDIQTMHAFIREEVRKRFTDADEFRILYGGSVKPNNAKDIFELPDVDGGLVGGASLKAEDFLPVMDAAS